MENKEHETKEQKAKETKKFKINTKYALAAVITIAVLGAAAYIVIGSATPSVVAAGDIINVSYTGKFTNGTVFGTNVGGQPMQFTVGSGQLIKGFDQGVIGMHIGENRTLTVPPSEGYGQVNSSLIVQVPSNVLGNTTINVGMVLTRRAGTQQEEGLVTAVNGSTVTVNFNPPLAGHTLVFNIKVLAIRRA